MRRYLAVFVAIFSPGEFTGGPKADDRPIYPVVVVPGILGSRLCRDDNGEPLWGDTARGSFENFNSLDLAGSNPTKLHHCGIVKQI